MTLIAESTTLPPQPSVRPAAQTSGYVSGVCNIGPAGIARRRRAGHVGTVATVGLLTALIAAGAPPIARLLVALPASVTAVCYLEARERFCARLGSRGLFDFGTPDRVQQVVDSADRARDRARATRISLAGGAIGLAVGIAAVLLPR